MQPTLLNESEEISVGTSLTEIFVVGMHKNQASDLVVTVQNTGGTDFNAFSSEFRGHPNAEWKAIFSAAGDWTAPVSGSFIRWAESSPVTLAAGTETVYKLREVNGWYQLRWRASVASGSTTAKILLSGY